MPAQAKAICVECYSAWYQDIMTHGSSNIQHYFDNEEIEGHLEDNYDPETGGHSMGLTFIWIPE